MVTILPKEEGHAGIGEAFGTGLVQGYQKRADESAIRNAIQGLGQNASAKDILNALTNTQTYSNEAKQNFLKNYLGVEEFEEVKRKAASAEETGKQKFSEEKRATKKSEEQRDRQLDIMEDKAKKVNKQVASEEQLRAGLQTVKEMRDLRKKGNLGIGTGVRKVFSPEARKDAGQYEQLGKSLIALSTTIPIRNRLEFETLAEKLYDPSISDGEAEGTLNAMENILLRGIGDNASEIVEETAQKGNEGKIRVRNKATGKTGTVTPFEGMENKYERI